MATPWAAMTLRKPRAFIKPQAFPTPAEQQPKLAGVSVLALEALGVGPGLNVGKAVMAGLCWSSPAMTEKQNTT